MIPQQLVERCFQVDHTAIRRYADITQDYNPIHLEPDFAAKTAMGGVIAHGMLSLSLLWQSLTATFGLERMEGIALDIRFQRPVREGDWVVAGGSWVDSLNRYDIWVRADGHDRSEIVIVGTATLQKTPAHAATAASISTTRESS